MLVVSTDIPADQLKEIMIRCYKQIDSDKAKYIKLTTKDHSYDNNAAVVQFSERIKRIASSNA